MRKLLITLILMSILPATMRSSDDIVRDIDLRSINIRTRSLTDAPEASIQRDILTVSFDGSGIYSLYVEDSFGITVYSSALPANGMEYDYDLSNIGEGLFRLILSGPSGEYEGHFTIHD